MDTPGSQDVTELLAAWGGGDRTALERLVPLVYAELKRIARRHLFREVDGHILQTTALVHEAYLKMVSGPTAKWQDRAHFFAVSSQQMRRILVDAARSRLRKKRGGDAPVISLDDAPTLSFSRAAEFVALDDALNELATLEPRRSRVVEMRYFGGMSMEETAAVLNLSPASVLRDWNAAKAWLYTELNRTGPAGDSGTGSMNAERYGQIDALAEAALKLEGSQRADFVQRACGSDQELLEQVNALLRGYDSAGDFLEEPALKAWARDIAKATPEASLAGKQLGRYLVKSRLGAGGIGEVWLAQDQELGRDVALKFLSRELAGDSDQARRFRQEARTASALSHSNLVTIFDISEFEGRQFIAQEYIRGKTVREALGSGPFEV